MHNQLRKVLHVQLLGRTHVLTTFLLMICAPTFSQNFQIAFHAGYGKFNFTTMNKMLDEEVLSIKDTLGITVARYYDFPDNFILQGSFHYAFNKHSIGLEAGNSVTGSRIDYEDYSGYLRVDKTVKTWPVALTYSWFPGKVEWKIKPSIGLGMGLAFSKLSIHESFEIYISDDKTDQSSLYTSTQFYFLPKARVQYHLLKSFFLEAKLGYFLQVTDGTLNEKTKITDLMLPLTHKPALLDWSGLRAMVGIGLKINSSQEKKE